MFKNVKAYLANRKVQRAVIGIPLCLLGVVLIFVLKPRSGSTVTGLAVLTAVIQALGAVATILFFSALADVIRQRSVPKPVTVEILDEVSLKAASRQLGRHALIDTRPNPEHVSEWLENTTGIVGSSLSDFIEKHRVSTTQFKGVLAEVEEGLKELIRSHTADEIGFALSQKEVLALVSQIAVNLSRDPAFGKILDDERPATVSGV